MELAGDTCLLSTLRTDLALSALTLRCLPLCGVLLSIRYDLHMIFQKLHDDGSWHICPEIRLASSDLHTFLAFH